MNTGRPRLLVYADEDYLIPIIIDEDGKLCKYEAPGGSSNRLWLYFLSSSNGIFYDKSFKSRALFRENGYYCNIWDALEKDQQMMIGNKEQPFWSLLHTSVLGELKAFWDRSTSVPFSYNNYSIPTVYLFADSEAISECSKSRFLQKMKEEGFPPISFSVNPIIPVCRYVQTEISSFKPEFGNSILFLNSVGETLRFSSAVFDGESFLTDGKTGRVENFGETPLKNALVRHIVDAVDHSCGRILTTTEKREAEYRYQLRNADKWFNIRREENGDFDVEDFLFSFDPEGQSPRTTFVHGSFLETEQENTARQAIEKINQFVYEVLGQKPVFIVFFGEAFEDDTFTTKILQKLYIKDKIVFTPNTFAKALFQYFDIFQEKEESIERFDKIFKDIQRENKGVSEWIRNASKIIAIEKDLSNGKKELEAALKKDNDCFTEMMNKCANHLKKSRFEEARNSLSIYELPSSRVVSAKRDAQSAREKSREMTPLYERIECIGRARLKVSTIHELEDTILTLSKKTEENAAAISAKQTRIDELEARHPDYIALKRKFDREKDYRTRKSLIEQMRGITEEELPEITLTHVTAKLSAQIEVGGNCFKKTRTLKFSVVIDRGEQLPCGAELHIATKSLTSVEDRMCYSFDIPKGSSGTITGELRLPHPFVEPKKTIYLYLFPNEEVVDKNAIHAEFIYVKQ